MNRLMITLFLIISCQLAFSQTQSTTTKNIVETIGESDKQFWDAYNTCDLESMSNLFTKDVEFYQDKNGKTSGLDALKKSLEQGLCANGSTLKREPKEGTIQIFELKGIGGIISGEHYFLMNGQAIEVARFNHLWVYENGKLKMSRVLSYDHKPVSSETQAITLSQEQLQLFTGHYQGQQTGKVEIISHSEGLTLKANGFEANLYPKSEDTFFMKERNITFSFLKDKEGTFEKIQVKENGQLAEELLRIHKE